MSTCNQFQMSTFNSNKSEKKRQTGRQTDKMNCYDSIRFTFLFCLKIIFPHSTKSRKSNQIQKDFPSFPIEMVDCFHFLFVSFRRLVCFIVRFNLEKSWSTEWPSAVQRRVDQAQRPRFSSEASEAGSTTLLVALLSFKPCRAAASTSPSHQHIASHHMTTDQKATASYCYRLVCNGCYKRCYKRYYKCCCCCCFYPLRCIKAKLPEEEQREKR